MKVSELGVGKKAEEVFGSEGVETLFPPQEEAVKAGVMEGESLVLSTPTASGKTAIAELAALGAMRRGGQVAYIVPLRALASEKFADFQKWGKLGFRVGLQMGDLDSKFLPRKNTADLLIATAEKCDSILRSRPDWFRDVRLLVIDEIHLITTDRGPTYEVLLAKFRKMFPGVQVLGLSATIGNAGELGEWLGAKVIKSGWRPVRLTQRIKQGKGKALMSEARKTMDEGAQSLVFVNSRRSAEAVADRFAERFRKLLDEETAKALERTSQEILGALSTPTAQCKRLANAVRGGAAFHHAGLVNKQRGLVEQAFKQGLIKVITATPTLAAGLNMPARKVIIRDIKRYTGFGLDYIPVLEYLQMAGRAGRPKYDKEGESVLLAKTPYEMEFLEENYIEGEPENIHSRLGVEPVLRTHVLASVASGFTHDKKGLMDFFEATFFAHEYGTGGEFKRKVDRVLRQLEKWGFIKSKGGERGGELFVSASDIGEQKTDDARLIATPLGSRVSELYIDPETAHDFVEVFEDPERAAGVGTFGLLEFMCSASEMRPLLRVRKKEEDEMWGLYYEQEHKLLTNQSDSDYLNRFKTALMLNDWIEERTEDWILKNYGMAPGLVRIKLNSARWLAYSFSELVPYIKTDKASRRELQKLETRLKHGIREELLPLASVKGVGRVRARRLFKAGIRGRKNLRGASAGRLEELLGEKTAEKVRKELS